jgi:outer membrane protein
MRQAYYFDLLVAQVNLQIAEKNRSNNDTLYKIAGHKLELGKISQNDLLQLQMGLLTAQKTLLPLSRLPQWRH